MVECLAGGDPSYLLSSQKEVRDCEAKRQGRKTGRQAGRQTLSTLHYETVIRELSETVQWVTSLAAMANNLLLIPGPAA